MQKSIFLIICGLSVAFSSLTFDSSVHCSCDSLTTTECPDYYYESCVVSGSQCIVKTITCGALESGNCNSSDGCIWDSMKKSCIEISSITCSNYTEQKYCLCHWNKSNECETFSSCENYDHDHCPTSQGCTSRNDSCAQVVCSDYKAKNDCYGTIDKDTSCAWSDKSECVEISYKPSCSDLDDFQESCKAKNECQYASGSCNDWACSGRTETLCTGYIDDNTKCAWSDKKECVELSRDNTCTDLDDFKEKCNDNYRCQYVDSSSTCNYKACSDYKKGNCDKAYTDKTEYVLCDDTSGSCVELTDTTTLTEKQCLSYTSQNYHWTTDGKCQECATLISEDDFGNIIMGIISIILILS